MMGGCPYCFPEICANRSDRRFVSSLFVETLAMIGHLYSARLHPRMPEVFLLRIQGDNNMQLH